METVQHLPHLQNLRQNHDYPEWGMYALYLRPGRTWVGTRRELLPKLRKAGYG